MKSVFSLSLFLFATLELVAGQLPVEAYNELLELCNRGGEDTVSSQLGTKCTSFHVTLQTVAVRYAANEDTAYKYGECCPYEGATMAVWCKSASCYSYT